MMEGTIKYLTYLDNVKGEFAGGSGLDAWKTYEEWRKGKVEECTYRILRAFKTPIAVYIEDANEALEELKVITKELLQE